jgi:hypothetical protein
MSAVAISRLHAAGFTSEQAAALVEFLGVTEPVLLDITASENRWPARETGASDAPPGGKAEGRGDRLGRKGDFF